MWNLTFDDDTTDNLQKSIEEILNRQLFSSPSGQKKILFYPAGFSGLLESGMV
jgi:hypothetical protein